MAVLSLLPLLLFGVLYVWFLGLAAKWILKLSVARKLRWIFIAIVLAITMANTLVSQAAGRPALAVLGLVVHLLVGAWFFGKFAVRGETQSSNFIGGLKMTAAAMTMLLVTCGVLIGASWLLLARPA